MKENNEQQQNEQKMKVFILQIKLLTKKVKYKFKCVGKKQLILLYSYFQH